MPPNPRRGVFLSHTSELRKYPKEYSFVTGAEDAVAMAGDSVTDMKYFTARNQKAASYCREKVTECDVYVGIIGFCYGSPVRDRSDLSYTELEYQTAVDLVKPRLIFLLEEIPEGLKPKFAGQPHADRQKRFRDSLKKADDITVAYFRNPDDLKAKLYQALIELSSETGILGLSDCLREVFTPLVDDHKRVFGGRRYALDRIHDFIEDKNGRYLALTAEAGMGKTALMAKLISQNPDIGYHFFTSKQGRQFLTEEFFLKNVVQQLADWYRDLRPLPDTSSELLIRYYQLLKKPLTNRRVLILDGLDEVTDWSLKPYMVRLESDNLKVIVTIRDTGQDWLTTFGLPADQLQVMKLGGLTREDVQAVLRAAGGTASKCAADPKLLNEIIRVAVYKENEDLGVDPLYMRFLSEEIANNDIVTVEGLAKKPQGLEGYLEGWWMEIKNTAIDQPARDLFGTLTAALGPISREDLEAINPSLVDEWIQDFFFDVLGKLRRAVSGNDKSGYVLAHPRLRDYMQKTIRIAPYESKLFSYCLNWQQNRSSYALTYFASHARQPERHKDLFDAILDVNFQNAQREVLGQWHATLTDIQTALEVALERDDLVKIIAAVGAFRSRIRSESISQDIFRAVDNNDPETARRLGLFYRSVPRPSSSWAIVLQTYLAWEASERGDIQTAKRSLAGCRRVFVEQRTPPYENVTVSLAEALLVRAARAIAVKRKTPPDPAVWLKELAPGCNVTTLLEQYVFTKPLPLDEMKVKLAEVENRIRYMETAIGEGQAEGVSAVEFIDEERAAEYAGRLKDYLVDLAFLDEGRMNIDRALNAVLTNPYPRYRDNALVALGIACLAVIDTGWARKRIRYILETGLDEEGIVFTLDAAAILSAEAETRGLEHQKLSAFMDEALKIDDRWGTMLRARSARAAAHNWQGRDAEAAIEMEEAARQSNGFAGFISFNLITLANRWCEIGCPQNALKPVVDCKGESKNLLDAAEYHARLVRDPAFQKDRVSLAAVYKGWFDDPTPDEENFPVILADIPDPDARRIFKDLVTARWCLPPGAENLVGIKALIPQLLADGSIMDAVLGRLIGIHIRQHRMRFSEFTDMQLSEAIRLTGEHFTVDRPWLQFAKGPV